MRLVFALSVLASPATAWDFQAFPVCTLVKNTDEATISVTHSPDQIDPFAITLDLKSQVWDTAPNFAMRFDGPGQRTISTNRHQLSTDRRRLTVADQGFENVLEGLARNFVALARSGETAVIIPLEGARPKVDAFVACLSNPAL